MKDYYKILGVTQQASAKEIKAAYRRLAKQYHPDVVRGDKEKEDFMREIGEAYSFLGDEEKRKTYDAQRRKAGVKAEGGPRETKKDGQQSGACGGMPPDMSQFGRFFGFQPGKGMETYRHKDKNIQKPQGPMKPEEMFEFFLGRNGGRR